MIYVDQLVDWDGKGESCHLITDGSPTELHNFVFNKLKISPRNAQVSRTGWLHYDLNSKMRKLAVKNGAQEVSKRNLIEILKTTWKDMGGEYAAVTEMKKGKGVFRICQLQLNNRINSNPAAKKFAMKLLRSL